MSPAGFALNVSTRRPSLALKMRLSLPPSQAVLTFIFSPAGVIQSTTVPSAGLRGGGLLSMVIPISELLCEIAMR